MSIARRRRNPNHEAGAAWLFLLPSLLGFLLFVVLPFIMVVYLSFMKYNIIARQVERLQELGDADAGQALLLTLGNSARFVLLLVPMHMLMGPAAGAGVNSLRKSSGLVFGFRTVFYFPTLLATSSIAIAWSMVLNRDFGLLNYYLGLLGVEKISWLNSSFWVYPATMLFSLWKFVGGYFLYFLIGLQGIDKGYLEAAEIDGASAWQKTRPSRCRCSAPPSSSCSSP